MMPCTRKRKMHLHLSFIQRSLQSKAIARHTMRTVKQHAYVRRRVIWSTHGKYAYKMQPTLAVAVATLTCFKLVRCYEAQRGHASKRKRKRKMQSCFSSRLTHNIAIAC